MFSWFKPQYAGWCKRAIDAVEKWFAMINVDVDYFEEIDLGKIRIYLFGSDEIGRREFRKTHPGDIPSTAGCVIPGEHYYELWLHVTKTRAGNMCINEWGGGHELMHIIDIYFRRRGVHFGNPDKAIEPEFYS